MRMAGHDRTARLLALGLLLQAVLAFYLPCHALANAAHVASPAHAHGPLAPDPNVQLDLADGSCIVCQTVALSSAVAAPPPSAIAPRSFTRLHWTVRPEAAPRTRGVRLFDARGPPTRA
jgi:hypothetical protein